MNESTGLWSLLAAIVIFLVLVKPFGMIVAAILAVVLAVPAARWLLFLRDQGGPPSPPAAPAT